MRLIFNHTIAPRSYEREISMRIKRSAAAIAAAIFIATTTVVLATPSQAVTKIDYCKAQNLTEAGGMDALVTAAKKEGQLNVITLASGWANYDEAIALYKKAFGIKIVNDNPDGSSAYELQTIKTAPASKQPDVVDIGATHLGAEASDTLGRSLFAPYKVATWNDITPVWKDTNGLWYGDYQGTINIAYDASVTPAPTKISDLANPAYKGMVALGGDPSAATESFMSVFAASIANGGSVNDIKPGIEFFRAMKASGNFVTVPATGANLATGAFKIALSWSFNGPGFIQAAKGIGKTLKYVTPTDVVLKGSPYIQAINAKAPHCANARLWEEFLYSENKGKFSKDLTPADIKLSGSKLFALIMGGQNIFNSGAAHPITEAAMIKKGTLIPAPAGFAVPAGVKVISPTLVQQFNNDDTISGIE